MKTSPFHQFHRLLAGPLCLTLLAIAGCGMSDGSSTTMVNSTPLTVGSGKSLTQARNVGAFLRIKTEGAAQVEVTVGPATSVSVTTDDNLQPLIETDLEGGTLHIYPSGSYKTSLGVKLKITAPVLEELSDNGASKITVTGLAAQRFALAIAGAGSARLEGRADSLVVRLGGAGNIQASDLSAKTVQVDIAGAGNAEICATESLNATVSGVGRVRYSGHPAKVQKQVTGVGSIQPE